MFDSAAHLVDRVLPSCGYRQWVLAFPRQIKLRLAYDRECLLAVRSIAVASIFAWQRRRARALGIKKPLCGAISFVQRFSSSLAISPHLHLLVLDGVFFDGPEGALPFRALARPTVDDLAAVTGRIIRRMKRWLGRHEVVEEPRDGLAQVQACAALVQRRPTVEEPPDRSAKLVANVEGFSLEAGRHVHQSDREGLERLARYMARPPLAMNRVSQGDDGKVVIRFKRPLFDGSWEVRLSPMELLRRLAALVPPPGFHLTSMHGVFASGSRHRSRIVPASPPAAKQDPTLTAAVETGFASYSDLSPRFTAPQWPERYLSWADLLRRTRGLDLMKCGRCGGKMALIAVVTDADLAAEILTHLGLSAPTRGPPT